MKLRLGGLEKIGVGGAFQSVGVPQFGAIAGPEHLVTVSCNGDLDKLDEALAARQIAWLADLTTRIDAVPAAELGHDDPTPGAPQELHRVGPSHACSGWHNACMSHANNARPANLLGSLSLAVADRMRVATEAAAGSAGSGPAALAALSTYLEGEPIDSLGRSLGLTHSATVRLVDRLEDSGLVERGPGVDGRSVSVVMTSAGRRAGREILDARQRALGEVLDGLNPSERHTLVGVCEKLLGGPIASRADARRICRLCDPDACGHYDGRCPVTKAADRAAKHSDAVA